MKSRSRKGIGAFIVVACVLAANFVLTFEQHPVREIGMNGTVRSADGTEIAYTTLGTGPAVIIVDGAFCYRDNGPAAQLASILAEHFTVFTYDRRGHGESSDSAHYATAREVDDLRSLVQKAHGSAFGRHLVRWRPRPPGGRGWRSLIRTCVIRAAVHRGQRPSAVVSVTKTTPQPACVSGRSRRRRPVLHDEHL